MRLIDADKLFESIRDYEFDTTTPEMRRAEHLVKSHICELIEKQPTAYDVDNVVKQLEESTYRIDDSSTLSIRDVINEEDAIEIVKSGGIDGH